MSQESKSQLEVTLNISEGSQVTFSNCTFNINATEDNARQTRAM